MTPWTAARQSSLSITNSRSLLKLVSIASVMPSNHLILCHPLLLPPSIFPSIRVFFGESVLHIRWPKYWSFSFNISPSNEYSGLISFRIDWLDLYATTCKIMLDICATMCKIASGKLLCSTGSSAQCSVMTGGVGWKSGKEAQKGPDDCILTADSCCCTVETSTTL